MTKVWSFGSLNMDFVVGVNRFPVAGETVTGNSYAVRPGGKGANQAMAAASLGASVGMVGKVGNDPNGRHYRRLLEAAQVDCRGLEVDEHQPTGVAMIEVETSGENRIVVVPGANGSFDPEFARRQTALVNPGDLVLLQLEIPLGSVLVLVKELNRRGAKILLDPAPAQELPPELWALVDHVTPNGSELATLTGLETSSPRACVCSAETLIKRGARSVVLKAGGDGCFWVTAQGCLYVPARPTIVRDTTGAGDAFNGGLAAALARGLDMKQSLGVAAAAGAFSCRAEGAQGALATWADVQQEILQ